MSGVAHFAAANSAPAEEALRYALQLGLTHPRTRGDVAVTALRHLTELWHLNGRLDEIVRATTYAVEIWTRPPALSPETAALWAMQGSVAALARSEPATAAALLHAAWVGTGGGRTLGEAMRGALQRTRAAIAELLGDEPEPESMRDEDLGDDPGESGPSEGGPVAQPFAGAAGPCYGPAMHTLAQPTWNPTDGLVPVELPTPEPRANEVRVAVKAIGVNPVDWKMRQKGPLRLAARLLGPPLPFVPGVDFAGVVDAVGPRVTSLMPGDRVVGGTDFSRGQRGSYADTVIARPDQITRLPDTVDFETAGALPVAGVTAAMAVLEFGRLEAVPADARRVLVIGASGGVGQLAVQIARNAGARVVGICSARNVERVRALGATRVIDYGVADVDPLAAAAEDGPYRVIVDCVGSYPAAGCRRLLGPGGRHVMVAGDSAGAFFQALVPPFSSRILLGKPTGTRLAPLVQAIAEGRLQVDIAQRFPLARAEAAHALSQSGRVVGKIVLVV